MLRIRGPCSYNLKIIGLLFILVGQAIFFSLSAQSTIPDSVRIKAIPLTKINTKDGEYSPFKYRDKFYFVSDRENDFAVVYYDQSTSHQFSDLYRATIIDSVNFRKIDAISNQFKTKFYIGPSCETKEGFYSTMNNSALARTRKQLPLQISYLAKDEKNRLLKPKRITFGLHDTISCAQPSVWADTLMFFASDLFGSTGKIDLFYSIKKNDEWQRPVSCGLKVNSEYNEVFPFYMQGFLYFASDRPNGSGGLDIYRIELFNQDAKLERLSNPINGPFDDFGVYIDSTLNSGYFSSNRNGNDDIFYFKNSLPDFDNCTDVKSNNYCFTFYEEASLDTKDTLGMTYEWNFGDGAKKRGLEVQHCYDGEGKFLVELNVVDKTTGQLFFNEISYDFEIKNIVQIYIHAPDTAPLKSEVSFDPTYTNIDSLDIRKYFWEFGDGSYSFEDKPKHVYEKEGTYIVKLGLEGFRNGRRYKDCAIKKITISSKVEKPIFAFTPPIIHNPPIDYKQRVLDSLKKYEKEFYDFLVKTEMKDSVLVTKTFFDVEIDRKNAEDVGLLPKPEKDDKTKTVSNVYSMNEKDSTVSYKVHIGVSEDKIETTDPVFKGLKDISSVYQDSLYHYFTGDTRSIKELMPYFEDAKSKGFKSSVVSTFKDKIMQENPNLRQKYMMYKDTIEKGKPRVDDLSINITKTQKTEVVIPDKTPQKTKETKEDIVKTTKSPKEISPVKIPEGNRVEIGTYATKQDMTTMKNLGNVVEVDMKDGTYKYFTEDVRSPENAQELKNVLIELGYKNAKIPGEPSAKEKTNKFLNELSMNKPAGPIAYRVQIGAYRIQKPKGSFDALKGAVKEFKTEDGFYKYVTEDVKTLENALDLQSALLSMGYKNAFVTAYEGNRRIPLIESILAGLSVYFNLDSYQVLPSEKEKIDLYFKKFSTKNIKEIELEGNTCNLGTAEYNYKLSERRVLAVEEVLTPYVKVKINRKFLGEFYPLHKNYPESVRKLNRRVDVVILE